MNTAFKLRQFVSKIMILQLSVSAFSTAPFQLQDSTESIQLVYRVLQ